MNVYFIISGFSSNFNINCVQYVMLIAFYHACILYKSTYSTVQVLKRKETLRKGIVEPPLFESILIGQLRRYQHQWGTGILREQVH